MPAAVYSRRDGDGVKREKEMMRNERVKKNNVMDGRNREGISFQR